MANDAKVFNLDDFMEKDFSALPDAPKRSMMPNGKHVIQIVGAPEKTVLGEKPALKFKYKLIQHVELAAGAAPLDVGTELEEVFFVSSEGGLGALKEHLKNLPAQPLKDLLPALDGQQFVIVTKQREFKDKQSGEKRTGWNTVDGLKMMGG